ncbi:MAG TPA: STAS domain-containing protein [Gaiellaceae bacterium]|jgi:anti-sigma B factor antagonist
MADEFAAPLREPPVRAVEEVGDAVVVRLAGELDLHNAPDVRAALADAIGRSPARVVVDLSAVEFVDSTALGALVEAHAKLGAQGLALAAPQHEPRRTLHVSGLDRRLAVHDTVEAALGS